MGSTRDGSLNVNFGSFSSDDLNSFEPTISLPVKKRSVVRTPSRTSTPQVDENIESINNSDIDTPFSQHNTPTTPPLPNPNFNPTSPNSIPVQHEPHQPLYSAHYEHIPYIPYNHHPYMQPYNPYMPHQYPPPHMAHMHMMPYGIPQQHVVNPHPHPPPPHMHSIHHPTPLSASSPSFTPAHLVHSASSVSTPAPASTPASASTPTYAPTPAPTPTPAPSASVSVHPTVHSAPTVPNNIPSQHEQPPQHVSQVSHPQQAQEQPHSQSETHKSTDVIQEPTNFNKDSQPIQDQPIQQTPQTTPTEPEPIPVTLTQSQPTLAASTSTPTQQTQDTQPTKQANKYRRNRSKAKNASQQDQKQAPQQQQQHQPTSQKLQQPQPQQQQQPQQPQQPQPQAQVQPQETPQLSEQPQTQNQTEAATQNMQPAVSESESTPISTNQETDSAKQDAATTTKTSSWASLFASRAAANAPPPSTHTNTTPTPSTPKSSSESSKPKPNGVHSNSNGTHHTTDALSSSDPTTLIPLSAKIVQDLAKLTLSISSPSLLSRGLKNPTNTMGCLLINRYILQSLVHCPPFAQLLSKLGSLEIPQPQMPVTDKFIKLYKEFSPRRGQSLPSSSSSSSLSLSGSYPALVSGNGATTTPTKGKGKGKDFTDNSPFLPELFFDLLYPFSERTGIPYKDGDKVNQQDAQEFLTYILDLMHEEFLSFLKKPEVTKTEKSDEWEEVGKKNKSSIVLTKDTYAQSVISHTFGGKQRSSVRKQSQGSKPSVTIQPFYCLHLDIDKPHIKSLEDAIDTYMEPEKLEGYTCDVRGVEVQASKHTSLEALPKVLIIHLKRFAYDLSQARKLDKFIRYPMTLTIKKNFLSNPQVASDDKRVYSLYSVVEHHGKVAVKGHYTCDINIGNLSAPKTTTNTTPSTTSSTSSSSSSSSISSSSTPLSSSTEWLNFDDHNVTRVNMRDVQNRLAYLLFYVQN